MPHGTYPGRVASGASAACTDDSWGQPKIGMKNASLQPGGIQKGLQFSNPVDAGQPYNGSPFSNNDALRGCCVGGVNAFGEGLALSMGGKKIGAIGLSGNPPLRESIQQLLASP